MVNLNTAPSQSLVFGRTSPIQQSAGLPNASFLPATTAPAQVDAATNMQNLILPILELLQEVLSLAMGGGGLSTASAGVGATSALTGLTAGAPEPQFSQNDALNYILGSTRGGTITQEASIFSQFMQPNSRFNQVGDSNEFDAAIAKIYAAQFAGYAQGIDVVFNPGDDINQIANNITQAQTAYSQLNPEAKIFSDVASVYRGDFGNRGPYNNPVLGQLLQKWGRADIAAKPLVGVADAQSIGGIVQALNEEANPAIRQAWLQDIFDFANNSPSSPSGAVPQLQDYQNAINIVQNGTLNRLMANFNQGIGTVGPVI